MDSVDTACGCEAQAHHGRRGLAAAEGHAALFVVPLCPSAAVNLQLAKTSSEQTDMTVLVAWNFWTRSTPISNLVTVLVFTIATVVTDY